jgi:hypothetical protein
MRKLNRIILPTLVALILPLAAAPAGAQQYERGDQTDRTDRDRTDRDDRDRDNRADRADRGRDAVRGAVEVVVRDLDSRRDIGTIPPGGTLTLPEGSRVRLIMTVPGRSGRQPLYPETEFIDVNRGGVQITRSNQENSNADLEILPMRNPNRVQTIRYQITERSVPVEDRTGTFSIRVTPRGTAPGQAGRWMSADRARELTRMLYLGILMREPDATGARSTAEAIQRGGLDAIVRAGTTIAGSDESRIRIYEREGTCNDKRLLALYRNLLGVDPARINRTQWDADLRRVNNGEIARVVEEMLRSDRFRSRYDSDRNDRNDRDRNDRGRG